MKIPEYDGASSLQNSDLLIVEQSNGTKNASVELLKSTVREGLQPTLTFDEVPTEGSSNPVKSGGVYSSLSGKVDKVSGKGLSTNDYTTIEREKLSGLPTASKLNEDLAAKQNNITGGTTGQILTKKSNTDLDFEWADNTGSGVPSGGTTGQVLRKRSSTDQDVEWSNIPEVPSGGATGQVLTKHSNQDGDFEWQTPEGSGDMLKSVYDTDDDGKVDAAEDADTVSGHTVLKDVPSDAKFTDTVYDDTEVRTLINGKISSTEKGAVSGVATLDSNGKVPSSQLPSYVDDVINGYYNNLNDTFYSDISMTEPITPEESKIYIDLSTNKEYRWSGVVYAPINEGLALGETAGTAYEGSKGAANATAIAGIKNGASINSFSAVESALSSKVDSVSGKGLSTNDYTDNDKAIVDGVTTALLSKVDKVTGKGLSTEDYTTAEQTKLSGIEAGAEVNDISSISVNGSTVTPDANKNVALTIMTNAVNDLVNYYLKSETYTKAEVNSLISAISTLDIQAVNTLPTTDISTTTIYLVPSADPGAQNAKDEYINLDGTTAGWEMIGTTAIDLSNYVTTSDLNTALASYTTTTDLTTLLNAKQPKTLDTPVTIGSTTYTTVESLLQALSVKTDIPSGTSGQVLRFNSNNVIAAESVITTATENSTSLITSGGVYSAINAAIGAALSTSY